jgi:ParB family transcriptional regulator, chromosome partitioning protein
MSRRPLKPSPMLGAVAEAVNTIPTAFLSGATEERFAHTMELDVDAIDPDPDQPRKVIGQAAIESLASTMKAEGQLQAIIVRRHPEVTGRWRLVAGERRWRAARYLGWPRILGSVRDGDPEIASLIENLQRVDLNPIEEAQAVSRLIDARGISQTKLAESLGRRVSDLNGILGILDLPGDFLQHFLTSENPPARNVLIELARVPAGPARDRLLEMARDGRLTVRQIRVVKVSEAEPTNNVGAGSSPSSSPSKDDPVPKPFSLKALGWFRAAVRESLQARRVLSADERHELEELARDISSLLASSDRVSC